MTHSYSVEVHNYISAKIAIAEEKNKKAQKQNAITGCLLGTAVGDALGLPMEGLSKRRQLKMYP